MRFVKMHGAGNDYVYVDAFRETLPADLPTVARFVSQRHCGIGADGLIVIRPSDVADAEMEMFNADGSLSEMCGNGIRCVAKYLYDRRMVSGDSLTIATGDGIKQLQVFAKNQLAEKIRVDMGPPKLTPEEIPTTLPVTGSSAAAEGAAVIEATLPCETSTASNTRLQKDWTPAKEIQVTCVSMGNPHCVIFVEEGGGRESVVKEDAVDFPGDDWVLGLGPIIEVDAHFPSRVNVEFVFQKSSSEVYQRTWERGSGETLACGTGASAVCVAGVLTGRTQREVTVHLKGGTLELEWDANSNHVFMTGPAVEVFRGEIDFDEMIAS